jgi:hypothetical protein
MQARHDKAEISRLKQYLKDSESDLKKEMSVADKLRIQWLP